MRTRNARLALLAGALLAAGAMAPFDAAAQSAAAGSRSARTSSQAEEPLDWDDWIQRLDDSARKLRELRRIEAKLSAEVERAKSRRYPRGEERQRLFDAWERARNDLAQAELAHPELLEQARQAGVPAGLLQDYEDVDEAPASPEE